MSDKCETPPAGFETNADPVSLVSLRLIETARGCATLAVWTDRRLPPMHQGLPPAEIAVGRLFEHRASVGVVVSGKPTPGMVEGDNVSVCFAATMQRSRMVRSS